MGTDLGTDHGADTEVALLRRQLERERRARRAAEQIGEAATAELWRTVQQLEQAEAELRDRAEQTALSYALARSLRGDLDPVMMLERAGAALGEALGLDRVVVRLAEGEQVGNLVTQWARPGVDPLPTGYGLDPDLALLVDTHTQREESLWIDDVTDDERVPGGRVLTDVACRAYAGVPLPSARGVIGWLALQSASEPRLWSPRDRAVAEALAHDLSGALLQARAHQQQIETVRELHEVDQVKNEFVWRVSHELRTPLTSIRGYAELLADGGIDREPSPAEQRTLAVILRNCSRLLSLTENLLSLSRTDTHEFSPVRDPIDVGALLERLVERTRGMVGGRALEVTLPTPRAVPAGSALLVGDESELERAVVHLVGNAVKFTPDGGRVGLDCEVTDQHLLLEVSDTGCGIEVDDHRRVFERFYRTRQAQASEVPGAGLGLALVDSIVRAHGGHVVVDSALGEGATFRVVLPLGSA